MDAVIIIGLTLVLALVAPVFGVDSRDDFRRRDELLGQLRTWL